jgi:hypothetical protein
MGKYSSGRGGEMESLFANISMYETLRLILVGSFRICLQERLYLMLMAHRDV